MFGANVVCRLFAICGSDRRGGILNNLEAKSKARE